MRDTGSSKQNASKPMIWQVVGFKNSGKTTLITELVAAIRVHGYTAAVIKHDGHDHFIMDHSDTDSGKYRQAGANAIAVISDTRHAIIEDRTVSIESMIAQFSTYDYIIIEGFKQAPYPKLLMIREQDDLSLLQLAQVKAVVLAEPNVINKEKLPKSAACFERNEAKPIADYIIRHGVQ